MTAMQEAGDEKIPPNCEKLWHKNDVMIHRRNNAVKFFNHLKKLKDYWVLGGLYEQMTFKKYFETDSTQIIILIMVILLKQGKEIYRQTRITLYGKKSILYFILQFTYS